MTRTRSEGTRLPAIYRCSSTPAICFRAVLVAGLLAGLAPQGHAQIASLDKGHQLLVNQGLQIWGLNTDSFQYSFNYNNFTAANMNAVMWSYGQSNTPALSAGQKWGRWADVGNTSPA